MSPLLKILLAIIGLVGVPAGYVVYDAVRSPDNWAHEGRKPSNRTDAGYHAAPAPIAGAGLPALGIVAGLFWVVRRRRKAE
jgi:hypothetical protein